MKKMILGLLILVAPLAHAGDPDVSEFCTYANSYVQNVESLIISDFCEFDIDLDIYYALIDVMEKHPCAVIVQTKPETKDPRPMTVFVQNFSLYYKDKTVNNPSISLIRRVIKETESELKNPRPIASSD